MNQISIVEALGLLNQTLTKHHPELVIANPGVETATIESIREQAPCLPEQFFELISICDYSKSKFFQCINPTPLDRISTAARSQIDFFSDLGIDVDWFSDKHDCCRTDMKWREGWVPIGEINGDPIFLDMDPAPNGFKGQVVMSDSDGWQLSLQGYSLAHWLTRSSEWIDLEPAYYDPLVFSEMPPPSEFAG